MDPIVRAIVARVMKGEVDSIADLIPTDPKEHYLVECSICNTVISQCRCMGPKTVIKAICDQCNGIGPKAENTFQLTSYPE